ncbi:YciI family protein [Flindersiella endophytica]
MAIFAVQFRFVPQENERRLQARPKHREYLSSLREAGKLVTAGPFADDAGALLLYDVADEAEVRQILADDPYPAEVYEVELMREWRPLFPFNGD